MRIFFGNLTELMSWLVKRLEDYIKYPKKEEKSKNKWNVLQKIQDIIWKV